jgi:hypothetical protein
MLIMKENDGKFGRIPTKSDATVSPLSISGYVRTDGQLTGYVLSNGLKITLAQREEMERSGELA